jgi:DeoR/GlpR family transcriptional regulator of sugar metabolism
MTPAKRQFVIVNMLETEGPMSVRALGALTGVDHTTLGNDLASLELAGVVSREKIARPKAKQGAFIWRLT